MNYVNLILVLTILFSAYAGWKKGFILSSIELIGWTGSLLIGISVFPYASGIILGFIENPGFWTAPIIFIVSIILARKFLSIVFNSILDKVSFSAHQNMINKIFGIIPGFINGTIFAALLAIFFSGVPLGNSFSEESQNSTLVHQLTTQTKWMEDKIRPVFSDITDSTNILTIHPETNKLIKLPFKVKSARPRPDLEAKMLILINQERSKRRLKPLKADPPLREVAIKHSQDMFQRGYFSHYTPEGKDPFDRINNAKVSYLTAGENLALSPNLRTAHTGLMESPGHKANILHADFGRVGIGILDGGKNGIMVTQNFRN